MLSLFRQVIPVLPKGFRTQLKRVGIIRWAATAIVNEAGIMKRSDSILNKAIQLGKEGKLTLTPEFLSISATDNCNLRCIMCPGHAGMTGPTLSLEQAETLFDALGTTNTFGRPITLDMTAGEPLLNKDLHLIFKKFKEHVPTGKISLISNATLPVKGRVKEAYAMADRIGLSLDGATAETYHRIRRRGKFDSVIANIRDIAELRQGGKDCEIFQLLFVAMDQNIHELPAMIRLAADLGVPDVFAQAVEHRTTPFLEEGDNIEFSMPPEKIQGYLDEATAEAKRLGIFFNPTLGLMEMGKPRQEIAKVMEPNKNNVSEYEGIKNCSLPWLFGPRISQDKTGFHPNTVCCHMPETSLSGNLISVKEFHGKSVNFIFNSKRYWEIRQGLVDGTMAKDACSGCQYYNRYQWTPTRLKGTGTINRTL